MTEEETQPCLSDNKDEIPVVVSDLDRGENGKENSCERELLSDVNSDVVNEVIENEVAPNVNATVSEMTLNESDDKNGDINENPSGKEVEVNEVNNRLSDDDESETVPKDVGDESSGNEETCEEKVRILGIELPKLFCIMR